MAKVSVIVPVYNTRDYLPETVGSLRRQTEEEIEIILVDDGSTDGSGALCDRYARDDERIRVLHQENGGLSSARNAGVRAATSDYVLFVDGDDHLCDDAIETLVAAKDAYHADIVQFLYAEVEKSGQRACHHAESWPAFVESSPRELFRNLYRLGGVAASACTKLIKRRLAVDHPFEPVRHEDEMWCTRVFSAGVTVAYIPDVLYGYVMRDGSIIHGRFDPSKLDVFRVQEERIKALQALALDDLVEQEYARMYAAIVWAYKEAYEAGDTHSCGMIQAQFRNNKKQFLRSRSVKGKYRLLLLCMSMRFSFVRMYLYYREKRGS